MMKYWILALSCSVLIANSSNQDAIANYKMKSTADILKFCPTKKADIQARSSLAETRLREEIAKIGALDPDKQTFESVILAYDRALGAYHTEASAFEFLSLVLEDKEDRNAASNAQAKLEQIRVEILSESPKIYNAVVELLLKGKVGDDKRYYVELLKKEFEHLGLHLSADKRQKVKELKGELANLSAQFSRNIQEDNSYILATFQELYGLSPEFIRGLRRKDGQYVLTCDYPIYVPVMNLCKNQQIRKELYTAFQNRAYPANEAILEKMIAKRDQLAKVLNYPSYAEMAISTEMVASESDAHKFVDEMIERCNPIADREFEILSQNLPKGVYLNEDQKLSSFDLPFVINHYKKQIVDLDDEVVAEYFPIGKTLEGLISIYEKFFNLKIEKEKAKGFWHEDISVLSVKRDGAILGYILLDLYPREGKYSHACNCAMIPAYKGADLTAVTGVIANFSKPSEDRPSLLRHREVTTFFHEFGHAIHNVLGSTDMMLTCGTTVSTDFVELPSQLLEEWMYDPQMLRMVSSHYKSGEPLPDKTIEKIVSSRALCEGMHYLQQCFYAKLSLAFFREGDVKNTNMIEHSLRNQILRHTVASDDAHFHNSFGHLDGYGPLYYGYMWSKVFAIDIYNQIQSEGILNPQAGERYVAEILGKGGSEDPNVMLQNYLKRKPSIDPFVKRLGGGI